MSTNPEGNPQTTQDVIAALHLKLHHAEIQRDSAMTLLKAETIELAKGVLYEQVSRLHTQVVALRKAGTEMGKHLPDTDEANAAYQAFEAIAKEGKLS